MKMKFHIFLDRRQIFFTALTVLMSLGVAAIATDREEGLWWLFLLAIALASLALSVMLPCLYIMNDRGLYSFYAFGFIRRFIPWKTVRRLDIKYSTGYKRLPYFGDTFLINGKAEGTTLFFTENEMVRTRRARLLLEKYTGHPVEGYFIDDFRAWRKKRKEKQERMRQHRERMARVERNRAKKERMKRKKQTRKEQNKP